MVAYSCLSLAKENLKLLTTVGVDGTGRRVWLRTKQALGNAHFSPDGSQLAAMVGNTLELVTLADGNVRPIAPGGGGSAGEVSWSPDGSQLAFTRANQKGVWLVNRDGSNFRQLINSFQNASSGRATNIVDRRLPWEWRLHSVLSDGSNEVLVHVAMHDRRPE